MSRVARWSACLAVVLACGCGQRPSSPERMAAERQAVEGLVAAFWKAHESSDPAPTSRLLASSSDLLLFGTDAAEVMRTRAQWEAQVKADYEVVQAMKFGPPKNLSVLLAGDGASASVLCEIPGELTIGGKGQQAVFRFAAGVRKEGGEWRIVQGMVAVATVGESAAEVAAKLKAAHAEPAAPAVSPAPAAR